MDLFTRYRFHFQHRAIIVIAAALAFILFPVIAHANSMATMTFTFLDGPPQRVISEMVVISILIVLIESLFLWRMLKIGFWRAVWVVFVANVISSLIGLIIMALPFIGIIISMVLLIRCSKNEYKIPKFINVVIIICLLASPLLLLWNGATVMANNYFSKAVVLSASTLTFFGLSVIIEGETVKRFLHRFDIWKPMFIGNIITYVLLIAITADSLMPTGGRLEAWMSRAKGTLRSIGSSQLSYQESNDGKLYGSFEALKKDMLIAEGYTENNMIENYSMCWQINNISTATSEQFPQGFMSTFTVIAFPRDEVKGYLKTFAITDDRKVRVYDPKWGNRYENIKTWDPIL